MSGCITVFSRAYLCLFVCFFWSRWAGQDGLDVGMGRSERRESVSAAKFCLTQRKQNNPTSQTAERHSSLCPPWPPTHQNQPPTTPPPPPPSPGFPAVWHTEPALVPACTCVASPATRRPPPPHRLMMQEWSASQRLSSLALCISFLLHLHYPHNYMCVTENVWELFFLYSSVGFLTNLGLSFSI